MATADLTAARLCELESLPGEIWRPVLGYEDRYHVSNMGRVKALKKRLNTWFGGRDCPERIIKCATHKRTGYTKVALQKDRAVKHTTVHVVVLEAFVGKAPPKHETRHMNGSRRDNRLDNLAWGTKLENMRDQYAHGTRMAGNKVHCLKLTPEMVAIIRTSKRTGADLAKEFGVNITAVCKARRGDTHSTVLGVKPSA